MSGTWSGGIDSMGLGCRATCGLVDNIQVVPPGFAAWMDAFHPTLVGGDSLRIL